MPAKKDFTKWKPVKGDHATDTSYGRIKPKPGRKPTDEQQTAKEAKAKH